MTHYYAELFAGAGGLSRGLEAAGFHAQAHAEIEPHARAVLRKHWPACRLDGDVTQVNGSDYRGITLLSGGSPCQDLSVAGKRAGLGGSRSSLFFEQVRIWNESGAPYLLWENVYGALSSNQGRDFAAVLSALVGASVDVPVVGRGKSAKPKWQRAGVASGPAAVAAWRVLDLQHFGPPQRRVRVFVLAARTGGVDPAEVLALSEGVCGHPSPRQQARERVAGSAAGGARAGGVMAFAVRGREGGGMAEVSEEVPSLRTPGGGSSHAHVLAFHHTQAPISGDMVPAIGRTTDGMGVVHVLNDQGGSVMSTEVELAGCLRAATHGNNQIVVRSGADASEDGTGRGTPIIAYGNSGMESWRQTETAITRSERDGKGGMTLVMGDSNEATPVPSENVADAPLFALRGTTDAEAIRHTAGRSERVHASEVLRPEVHGESIRREGEHGKERIIGEVALSEGHPEGTMQPVWNKEREGCSPPGRESVEQRSGELGAALSSVSCVNTQQPSALLSGGVQPDAPSQRVLRDAQPAGEKVGRPAHGARESAFVGRPRRLTPRECEKLMSWPVDWTKYGTKEDGTAYELSDTARYRLCGNGVGGVCVEWIGSRLVNALNCDTL